MFDTMFWTKVVGGFCGTFLIFLLGGFFAELIYHPPSAHGDEEHAQAYTIDTGEDDAPEEEVEQIAFADVYANASADEGSGLFRQCQACHKLEDGANGVGPHLYGIVGRQVASVDGYSYSGALAEVAEVWTPENLDGFLRAPKDWAPGTKMSYSGMKDVEDRANLIAYLESAGS